MTQALSNQTDEIDASISSLQRLTQNETDAIDAALETMQKQVNTLNTRVVEAAVASLSAQVQNETSEMDAALAALDLKVLSETNALDAAVAILGTKLDGANENTSAVIAAVAAHDSRLSNYENFSKDQFSSLNDSVSAQLEKVQEAISGLETNQTQLISGTEGKIIAVVINSTSSTDSKLEEAIEGVNGTVGSLHVFVKDQFNQLAGQLTGVDSGLHSHINTVESQITNVESSIQTSMSAQEISLSGVVNSRSDGIHAAVDAALSNTSTSIQVVDTVVDGLATKLGGPLGAQLTIFDEFRQMQKGNQFRRMQI